MSSQSRLLQHRAALCNIVRRVALGAGDLILDYFENLAFAQADIKLDGSPVTVADRKAEEFIEGKLLEILPDIPMIGEETCAQGRKTDLSSCDDFWLVDPLDGTKEFISGSSDFTVNIALIHKGYPVLGVIYAPATGELFAGYSEENGNKRAFRWSEDTDREKNIHVRRPPKKGLTVVSSRNHCDSRKLQSFLEGFKVEKIVKKGSSLKICAVASGKADMYPRLGPTCEWDTAAGDAILRASGGAVKDLSGKAFVYGCGRPDFLNPDFVAASLDLF